MKGLQKNILEELVESSAEPMVVAQVDTPDWPVVLCNAAFRNASRKNDIANEPFADVIEGLVGRELALEISETIRTGQETTIPVEIRNQEYLLVIRPMGGAGRNNSTYYAGFLRAGAEATGGDELQQALLKAKKRIRDLSRDDPVTGLLNARAFEKVLEHDWAVAKRERASLALVAFTLDDFDRYREVFGRHAADTCQRRVAQAIRKCLKRASDVAARLTCGGNDVLVVLSHSSDEAGVREFACKIASSVRELAMHHPRSRVAKFVTVSYRTIVREAGKEKLSAADLLDAVTGQQ